MVRIESFSVAGLAGRKTVVNAKLNEDMNVLWGSNGCGKTSLLKILHSALTNDVKIIKNVPFSRARVKVFDENLDTFVTKTFDRTVSAKTETGGKLSPEPDTDQGEDLANYIRKVIREDEPQWKSIPDLPKSYSMSHGYLSISRVSERDTRWYRGSPQQQRVDALDEGSFDQIYATHIQNLWRRYSTEALSKTTIIQRRALSQVARTVIERNVSDEDIAEKIDARNAFQAVQAFFKAQNLKPPKTNLSGFIKHFEQDITFRKIVTDIVSVQYEVESSSFPVKQIETLLSQLFYGNKTVTLDRRDLTVRSGDNEVPLYALASGEKQLLRIFLECLAAGESCMIIDEPEISLHVDWQHDLLNYIRLINPKLQVIVATHSPEIMATLNEDQIFEL
ncbi:AAA family ATPase [Amycolatopsis sp. NPDC101161]|uniref:AAA family ATPase n=1 Tax=Amycolatopsis sp. NPDC101161 TaxID=3363940 RepID=UPI0038045B61